MAASGHSDPGGLRGSGPAPAADVGVTAGEAPPAKFGRYELRRLLGEGAMGRVYLAFDPLAGRFVALKTPHAQLLEGAAGKEYRERFRQEVQAVAALAHPNIVTVFDVGEDYFVMELLEGTTLQTLLGSRARLEITESLRILVPVADAIDFAHQHGVLHRDIKPGNIMLMPDGRIKLMDFGVARLTSGTITASGDFLGSPSYMAPELLSDGPVSERTDLFSLAVVAYELLTGRRPYEGENVARIVHQIVSAEPEAPSALNDGLPAQHDAIFKRALAKDPAARFAGATAFVAALGRRDTDAAVAEADGSITGEVETQDLRESVESGPAAALRLRRRVVWPWWRRRRSLAFGAGSAALALGLLASFGRVGDGTVSLQVTSDPPGGSVEVDGRAAGSAPVSLARLPPGPHNLRVKLDGFAPAELTLELPPGAPPAALRFTLEPLVATVQVRSEPEGARLFVDGKAVGRSPLESLFLAPGKYTLAAELDGHARWSQVLELEAGDTVPLRPLLARSASRDGAAAALRAAGWVRLGDLVPLEPGVVAPRKVSGESPAYPASARDLNLTGTTGVEMTITEQGAPADLRIVESAGELLDQAVLSAVRTWRYTPAERDGTRVRVRIRMRHTFAPAA
jgi:TonB family protein